MFAVSFQPAVTASLNALSRKTYYTRETFAFYSFAVVCSHLIGYPSLHNLPRGACNNVGTPKFRIARDSGKARQALTLLRKQYDLHRPGCDNLGNEFYWSV